MQEIKRRKFTGSEAERKHVVAMVPRATVYNACKRLGGINAITVENVFPNLCKKGRRALLSRSEVQVLQDIIVSRDRLNDTPDREEVIEMMSDMAGVGEEKAKDHFKYLVKSSQFPDLKRGGRVV